MTFSGTYQHGSGTYEVVPNCITNQKMVADNNRDLNICREFRKSPENARSQCSAEMTFSGTYRQGSGT